MEVFRSYLIQAIEGLGQGAFGHVEKIGLYNSRGNFCGYYSRKILNPNDEILKSITLDELKRRFTREVLYQSECSHKNVTPIYLFNKYAEFPYFVMDLAEHSLDVELANPNFDDEQKIKIFRMLLDGVKKVHDVGYLHRDIKPQNILKFADGTYRISDFGLVKNTDENSDTTVLTAIGQIMGTTRYMAPEVLYNAEYSKQTDIFAIGKVMEDLNVTDEDCLNIIKKCCSMIKEQRYSNISEIISDLNTSVSVININSRRVG